MQDAIDRACCSKHQEKVPACVTKEEAEAWYRSRIRDVPSHLCTRSHLYQTLIGWDEIESILLPHMARLGDATPAAVKADAGTAAEAHAASILDTAPVYTNLGWNPDSVLNALRYLYVHCRCGIFVAIRRGVVSAFFPFVNPRYTNTWGHKVQFPRGTSLAEYVAEKAAALRRAPEDVLPVSQWWMNSGIVCNVMPQTYWGDAYLAALRDMLDTTCALQGVPDVDFFINKRDHPVLTLASGVEPYSIQTGEASHSREVFSTYAPIFSFYTGTDMADLPMPPTEDWCAATGKSFPGSPYALPGLSSIAPRALLDFIKREAKAVFRGSATGTGTTSATNARLRLIEVACPDLVDAAVTGYNYTRDKIVGATADAVHIDFRRPSAKDPAPAAFMPLGEQFSRFRYVLYVDGHAAASRYGTLMHSGCVILKTASRLAQVSGHLWMFPDLVGGLVAGHDDLHHVPDNADHMIIDAEYGNLTDTIVFLNSHEELAHRIAENARKKAPSVENITRYWATVLRVTAAKNSRKEEEVDPSVLQKPWYSCLDKKYARMTSPSL